MEPFSTSVFKVLIWILATTTKICTRGCFIWNQFLKFQCKKKPPSPPTLWNIHYISKAKYWFESHFSAIHFRGRAIRQVSFYTDSLAGSDFHGHRPAVYMNLHPLWFLISVNFGTLTLRSVHPASPVLLTRVGPLRILYFIKWFTISNHLFVPI